MPAMRSRFSRSSGAFRTDDPGWAPASCGSTACGDSQLSAASTSSSSTSSPPSDVPLSVLPESLPGDRGQVPRMRCQLLNWVSPRDRYADRAKEDRPTTSCVSQFTPFGVASTFLGRTVFLPIVSWKTDIRAIIRNHWHVGQPFTLRDLYSFEGALSGVHPENRRVREKIRQTLQYLRKDLEIEFVDDSGTYRRRI